MEFLNGSIHVIPSEYREADAYVECSLEHLLGMVKGTVSIGKLFLNGQLKISGNLSKGFEIWHLLSPRE